ncbi:MAG: polysaccharide deacetylase family protein, partial [Bacteroidia bacterium]
FEWEGHPVFFATGKTSALPFDPFAAAFFLVSRYEEYLPHIRDSLDRFDAHQSIAWQHKFLHIPVVEKWAILLRDLLQKRFPELVFPARSYNYIPSLDIDNAWAYREKGFMRIIGGYLKDLIAVNVVEVKKRTRVLLGFEKDPYDTYSYQLELQKKYALKPLYFFLVADYGVNDKNVPVQNRRFRDLIRHIADYADVGVHPSFGSNREPERLRVEIGRLRTIIHRDITKSRQHFLMLKFPETYRNLMERDITDDYSMGYANEIGFRASISSAFNFYDLDQEAETTLRIHPFGVMDATLNYYMKLNPDEAVDRVRLLIDEVRRVNGTFMTLWHNETLSDEKQWKGWRVVYDRIVEEAHVRS